MIARIEEWEGSEEELVEIAETCVMNFAQDHDISESDEFLAKLFLEVLSLSKIQTVIRVEMQKIYDRCSRRLTRREDGHAYFIKCFDGNPCNGDCSAKDCDMLDKVCERLAMYEDADEMMEARPQNVSD